MSNEQIDISEKVMNQIHERGIRMKPRAYFIFGAVLLFVSIVFSIIGSIFLLSLTLFTLRTHGPMGEYRFEQLLSSFPWWAPLLAIAGVGVSIWLLKKYNFSYRHNFRVIVLGIIMAIFVAILAIEYFNLDNVWFRRGPMQGIMRHYMHNSQQRHDEYFPKTFWNSDKNGKYKSGISLSRK